MNKLLFLTLKNQMQMILGRPGYEELVKESIQFNPITAILGPRQSGKTTLARLISNSFTSTFFDLEDPTDYELLISNPKNILNHQKGLVIIDEVQRIPELFPILRVLADNSGADRKFLVLGSASPDLIKESSESLAGRI